MNKMSNQVFLGCNSATSAVKKVIPKICKATLILLVLVSATLTYAQPNITAIEYFFNTDPGPGNGTAISISANTTIDLTNINIPTTSLAQGWHLLCVRAKDASNVWGFYECRRVYIREDVIIVPDPPVYDITQLEFFYNNDNGPGTGTTIPITQGATIDVVNENLASTLPVGWHTVHVRAKNADEKWGFYESRKIFLRPPTTPCCETTSPIEELEYFVDDDPGVGLSSTKVTINPSSTTIDLVDEPLDVGTQSLGAHKIYIRAKNELGEWSMTEQANFTVITGCPILTAPTATGVNRCDPGPVTLTASGAAIGETYRWYATDSSVTPLFTGNPYITPNLTVNTTYYVSAYNPTTFCESGRTPVTASISGIEKPLLNISGTLSVCEGTSQLLSAPSGYSFYTWSNGLTTQQITVATTGNYSVVVNNGICSSPPSDAFSYVVNSKPLKPTITGTNGGSLCGAGTVTLSAPAGFSAYTWSSGQSTQNISVSSVGNFAVLVTNAAGCQSTPSDIFTVTSTPPAKPVITVTGSTTLCGSNVVQLSAPSGFSSYAWSNGESTQTITTGVAGTYTVIVSSGGCTSAASDAIAVTIVSTPAKPAITITGNTTLCNGAFTVLSAPTGFSHYVWSTGETTRQIVATGAGTFSVQTGTAAMCLSPVSDNVVIVVNGQPCSGNGATLPLAPTANNASRCGEGTVLLSASGAATGQEYKWYENSVGGISLSTSETFTTEVLTVSKDYYVATYDPGTLLESVRTKVTAQVRVFAAPVLSPTGNVSICEGSSLLVSAPGGFTHYQWTRDNQPFGNNTQQTSITQAGTYTVMVGDGTCYSSPSGEVIITIDVALSRPTISGSNTICESGTVVLVASAAPNYVWSTNETSSSISVGAGSYTVTARNGSCSAVSDIFVVNLTERPSQPVVIAQGKETICEGSLVALAVQGNFAFYKWSNGNTSSVIFIDTPGSYSVQVGTSSTCLSIPSEPLTINRGTTNECGIIPSPTNRAPLIKEVVFAVPIQSEKQYDLDGLIIDEDNNIDSATLRIVNEPNKDGKYSGGKATLEADHTITFDYRGINFSGTEYITLQVCDRNGLCAQQSIGIDVVGEVLVFNGITPNGDGVNDYMLIKFIDIVKGAEKNNVSIFNRWGKVVFEMSDYNNLDRVFEGRNTNGDLLPNGTYFYKVDLDNGKTYSGYLTLNR